MKHENINLSKNDVTLIIPSKDHLNSLIGLLNNLKESNQIPKEIIIIDCSKNLGIDEIKKNNPLNTISIYKKFKKISYPGKSRNIGLKMAKSKIIAFLDCNSLPNSKWMDDYLKILDSNVVDFVFGKSIAIETNNFNKNLKTITFGDLPYNSLSGSIFHINKILNENIFFNEKVRAGEDIEWINKIKKSNYINFFEPKKYYLKYLGMPTTFYKTIIKWFIYSVSSSKLNLNFKQRSMYIFILVSLLIYNIFTWNYNLDNWDQSPFFIPHVTKILLFSVIFFYFYYRFIYQSKKININYKIKLDLNFLKTIFIGISIDIIKSPGSIFGFFNYLKNLILNIFKN